MNPPAQAIEARNLEQRFHLYCILRNARFFDAFFVLFLLFDLKLSYTSIGLVLAYEKVLMGGLEVPLALVADRFGRRTGLSLSFGLVSIACLIFWSANRTDSPLFFVYLGISIYGIAEALRTGSHKAMVLHWLELKGEKERRVELLASMRFFSKTTTGIAALVGGIIVWQTGFFSSLFLYSACPAAACVFLLRSYPRQLEGAAKRPQSSQFKAAKQWSWTRLRHAVSKGNLWLVLVPSILFESQVKLAQSYLQPTIADGVLHGGFALVGDFGAMIVGAYLMLSGVFAGFASLGAKTLSTYCGSSERAVFFIHCATAMVLAIASLSLLFEYDWLGLTFLVFIAALQNIRRPLFIASADDVMASEYRTTILSLESQMRSWLFAISALITGLMIDYVGLTSAFAIMACVVALACLFGLKRSRH